MCIRGWHTVDSTQPDLQDLLARIDALSTQVAKQQVKIARLEAASTTAPGPLVATPSAPPPKPNRRAALRRLATGAAAAVGLLAATRAQPASAYTRTHLIETTSDPFYGLLATAGGDDPATYLPPLGLTVHGLIGVLGSGAPSPTLS